ncbi:(E)-beta-ocimene synthase chloroplastic [Dissostichus eleginoides]|uniref:(E)-beta-ocimene synthase chloroplastic n=1 Tax=Dissostichus eleginoides TaxID=100907 RepID=A0AAD9EXE9_DISEL|nr:(E)-beta-ocimene synthase chloroplastic [Dissostichus eleginoides]
MKRARRPRCDRGLLEGVSEGRGAAAAQDPRLQHQGAQQEASGEQRAREDTHAQTQQRLPSFTRGHPSREHREEAVQDRDSDPGEELHQSLTTIVVDMSGAGLPEGGVSSEANAAKLLQCYQKHLEDEGEDDLTQYLTQMHSFSQRS